MGNLVNSSDFNYGLVSIQCVAKVKLRKCKDCYRRMLEARHEQNNTTNVWSGMKKIIGFKVTNGDNQWNLERTNGLNNFFNKFSSQLSATSCTVHPGLHTPLLPLVVLPFSLSSPKVNSGQVRRQLENLNILLVLMASTSSFSGPVLASCL